MYQRFGIILLDEMEIIFRVYQTTDHEWTLFHYHSCVLPISVKLNSTTVLEMIGDFFATDYAQHIADWKMCTRHHTKKMVTELTKALAFSVEDISPHREQELLCKGLFTELW